MTNYISTIGMGGCRHGIRKVYEKLVVRRHELTRYGLLKKDEGKLKPTKDLTNELLIVAMSLVTVVLLIAVVIVLVVSVAVVLIVSVAVSNIAVGCIIL